MVPGHPQTTLREAGTGSRIQNAYGEHRTSNIQHPVPRSVTGIPTSACLVLTPLARWLFKLNAMFLELVDAPGKSRKPAGDVLKPRH